MKKFIYTILILALLIPNYVFAAVPTIADTPTTQTQTNGLILTTTHTANGDIAIVLLSHHYGADGVTSCTYGGSTMSRYGTFVRVGAYVYYLANPTSGSQTVTCTFVAGAALRSSAFTIFSISGGDTGSPVHVTNSANADSTTASVSQTTTKNDCIIFDVEAGNGDGVPSITGGQTLIYSGTATDSSGGKRNWGHSYENKATAAAETASWSKPSGEWEHVSASFCAPLPATNKQNAFWF